MPEDDLDIMLVKQYFTNNGNFRTQVRLNFAKSFGRCDNVSLYFTELSFLILLYWLKRSPKQFSAVFRDFLLGMLFSVTFF